MKGVGWSISRFRLRDICFPLFSIVFPKNAGDSKADWKPFPIRQIIAIYCHFFREEHPDLVRFMGSDA